MPIISRLRPFSFILPALSLLVFLGEPLPARAETEEPDYAFLTGGPYTQQRGQIQFIGLNFWGRRTSAVDGAELRRTQFDTALRTEWGLTDRWELDLVCGGAGERRRAGGSLLESNFAATDTLLGARYRFLREPAAPLTLTMGPQVILPTGDPQYGTGHKRVGLAWDVAAAKDWGGPVFLFSSVNYALLPSVGDRAQVNSREFHLHSIFGAFALGLRPLEKRRGDSHDDLHLFLELGAGRDGHLQACRRHGAVRARHALRPAQAAGQALRDRLGLSPRVECRDAARGNNRSGAIRADGPSPRGVSREPAARK